MNVTILGAGQMGSAMAQRLHDTGHAVTVWDRTPAVAERLGGSGVAVTPDITNAVSGASVVITMVTDGQAVRDVAHQMLPAMGDESVWVQSSTVGAEWADKLRELATGHHRAMLDAPVSGSTEPARTGTLTWLVAGPDAAVAAARPVLDALGRVLVVGPGQEASRLKLVVNTWLTTATVAIADTLSAADRLGVPYATLLEVLSTGPLAMPYASAKAQMMIEHDYTPGFPVELALKDIRLTEQAARAQPPLVHAVEQRLERAVAAGHGRDDLSAVATVD